MTVWKSEIVRTGAGLESRRAEMFIANCTDER